MQQQHFSYSGEQLTFTCDSKSPIRRTFTIAPESPALSFGFLTLADMLIVVFALAPHLQRLLSPSAAPIDDDASSTSSSKVTSVTSFFSSAVAALSSTHLLLRILVVVFIARVGWRIATRVPAERLTAVRNVGLQLHRQSLFGAWQSVELIDVGTITSLIVHEGFLRHRCVYFLAVVCQDRPRQVLPFYNTLPRLPLLQAVLRGTRAVLYGEPENGPTLSEIERDSSSGSLRPKEPTGLADAAGVAPESEGQSSSSS